MILIALFLVATSYAFPWTRALARFDESQRCLRTAIAATQRKFKDRSFENRSSDVILHEYLRSYNDEEKQRGILNQHPVDSFSSFADRHLIMRFGEYVAMSFCKSPETIQRMAQINARIGVFRLIKYGLDRKGNIIYYITANEQQKQITLVHRGSVNPEDYLLDLLGIPEKPDVNVVANLSFADNFYVHGGFWQRFKSYRKEIARDVQQAIAKYPDYSVIVVGHSLGAAWAYLEAADLVTNFNVSLAALYVYGMPKVGNQPFVDAIASTISPTKIVRFVNGNDLIPHSGMIQNASHPTEVAEYFIAPGSDDMRKCNGPSDPTCSNGLPCTELTWANHTAIGSWSMRAEWCRINTTVPNNVYE